MYRAKTPPPLPCLISFSFPVSLFHLFKQHTVLSLLSAQLKYGSVLLFAQGMVASLEDGSRTAGGFQTADGWRALFLTLLLALASRSHYCPSKLKFAEHIYGALCVQGA